MEGQRSEHCSGTAEGSAVCSVHGSVAIGLNYLLSPAATRYWEHWHAPWETNAHISVQANIKLSIIHMRWGPLHPESDWGPAPSFPRPRPGSSSSPWLAIRVCRGRLLCLFVLSNAGLIRIPNLFLQTTTSQRLGTHFPFQQRADTVTGNVLTTCTHLDGFLNFPQVRLVPLVVSAPLFQYIHKLLHLSKLHYSTFALLLGTFRLSPE